MPKKYIELEAAIELFEQAFDNNWEVSGTLDRLRAIPAADVVERPRWIPVEERLPEEDCHVLAYYGFNRGDGNLGMMFMQVMDYYTDDPRPHFQHEGLNGLTVTHWMPLPEAPEPPKEEA